MKPPHQSHENVPASFSTHQRDTRVQKKNVTEKQSTSALARTLEQSREKKREKEKVDRIGQPCATEKDQLRRGKTPTTTTTSD